jgi:hypothetical protein
VISHELEAKCVGGEAVVDVYVHDGQFKDVVDITNTIPPECEASKDVGRKVHFQLVVPCGNDVSFCVDDPFETPPTVTTLSPTATSPIVSTPTTASPTLPSPTAPSATAVIVPECKQHSKIVEYIVGSQNQGWPLSDPVEIVEQRGDTVRVRVRQTWKTSGGISWIAVQYRPVGSNAPTCPKINSIAWDEASHDFVAMCIGREAVIDVYVHDGQFTNVVDITSSIPGDCEPSKDAAKKVHFRIVVPCGNDSSFCRSDPFLDPPLISSSSGSGSKGKSNRREQEEQDPEKKDVPVFEPDENGDDGSYFCLSRDFPCEGRADHVYVCYYSTRFGY